MPEHDIKQEPQGLPGDAAPARRKSTFWPILATIIGGIVLAFGSFYAACSPGDQNSSFAREFGWVLGPAFFLGLLAIVFGAAWLVVALFLQLFYFLQRK